MRLLRRLGDAFWVRNDGEGPPYSRYELGSGRVFRGRLHDPKLFFLYQVPGYHILRTDLNDAAEVVAETRLQSCRFYHTARQYFEQEYRRYVDATEALMLQTLVGEEAPAPEARGDDNPAHIAAIIAGGHGRKGVLGAFTLS